MAKRKAAATERAKRQVKDVMIGEVMTIEASATLLDAAQQMRDANIGMLPVMEDGTLRGVITDRDLVVRAMSRDARASEMKVSECLSEPPRYAEPDWNLDDAMVEMARQHVGRLAGRRRRRGHRRRRHAQLAGAAFLAAAGDA